MSRLIVKNLPTYISDTRIREHFGSKGTITDVKLVHRQDGTSRRFAFVGFKTDADAQTAKDYFDRSYLDTSRITVQVVDPNGKNERPSKRQRLDGAPSSSKPSTSTATADPKTKTSKRKNDPNLDEFLQVMQPRNKPGRSWANDDPALAVAEQPAPEVAPATKDDPPTPAVDEDPTPDEPISDLDWMKRRMGKGLLDQDADTLMADASAPVFEQSDDEDETKTATTKEVQVIIAAPSTNKPSARDQNPDPETITETNRLFVRNLAYSCTSADLEEAFKKFGDITQAHIPLDPTAKTPKGLAFITFSNPANALVAYKAMDKSTFQGRILHVLPAVDKRVKPELAGEKSLKDRRRDVKKEQAGREFNWAMLYMNSDAVVSSVADRLKISKSDILNPESDNAAVKLALAETHVIQETKKYLEEEGVILDSFATRTSPRSQTTLLVKNIPYGTSLSDLEALFIEHGEISRLLLPPAGTMAVVEFTHKEDSEKAFRAVAYRRMGNAIIYLEKAPGGMWKEGGARVGGSGGGPKPIVPKFSEGDITSAVVDPDDVDAQDTAIDSSPVIGGTLFIKNLNFSTTSEKLINTFRSLPGFSFARVQTKPDPKRPGATLSMGYGFVGFRDAKTAGAAVKSMQGFNLDGHGLVVKFAQRGVEEEKGKGTAKKGGVGKSMTTKMIVKNLPFEVTKKDVRELFSAHGQLKSVRLPKKFDSASRGFAFLDFISRHEAENAYEALKHTHLLGRHIVLEWAEENGSGADVSVLRQRVKVGYGDGGKSEMPGRKRKLDMDLGRGEDEEEEGFVAV